MKKVTILLIVILLMANVVFADNSQRIAELQEEGKQLLEKKAQAEQFIAQTMTRIYEINGALQELTRQDKEVENDELDGNS